MNTTDLMIVKTLLRLLDAMAQEGVPIRTILMRAVADSIVADPSNEVTEYLDAYKLVQWYVDTMTNRVTGIEMLPLQTWYDVDGLHDTPDYPRWFRYQGQLYSFNLMVRTSIPGWDFESCTSQSNGTVYAAVLDEKTVRVGRIPRG